MNVGYNALFTWLSTPQLQQPIFGNSPLAWLSFLLASWLLWRALSFGRDFALKRLRADARSATAANSSQAALVLIHCLQRIWRLSLFVVALYVASRGLTFSARALALIDQSTLLLVLAQIGRCLSYAAHALIERRLLIDAKGNSARSAIALVNFGASCVIWALVALLALENLGVNVTTLIAGLGIGGIAVALAVQKILGDLLSSLSIVLDKPFVVGDTINVGDLTGSVEQIGIKTTKLRAPTGELVIVTNSDLLASRIKNFRALTERRCVFGFCLSYQLPSAAAAEIPQKIQQIISPLDHVRFERAHLRGFVENGLQFEVSYVVTNPDFVLALDVHQKICLAIAAYFGEARIEFAAPKAQPAAAARSA